MPPIIKGYSIVGKGSMLGEEDAASSSKSYSITAKCHTIKASVYAIKLEDFLTLKNEGESWNGIIEKSLWKEKQKLEHPMFYKPKEESPLLQITSYDIRQQHFEDLHHVLDAMDGINRSFQYKDS